MLIIVGKSATGKTQIVNELVKNYNMEKLVTYTTRPMRDGETYGTDYYFISKDDFLNKIKNGFFLEYVVYNGNYYGTSFSDLADNKVVILEPNGLKNYLNKNIKNLFVVFLRCSKEVLRLRMKKRNDSETDIEKRLLNDEEAFKDLLAIKPNLTIDTTCSNIYTDASIIYKCYEDMLYEK